MPPDTSTPRRSLLKGISWETFSLGLTFILAWLVFGRVAECIVFTVASFFVKIGFFFAHERAWHQIKWGKE